MTEVNFMLSDSKGANTFGLPDLPGFKGTGIADSYHAARLAAEIIVWSAMQTPSEIDEWADRLHLAQPDAFTLPTAEKALDLISDFVEQQTGNEQATIIGLMLDDPERPKEITPDNAADAFRFYCRIYLALATQLDCDPTIPANTLKEANHE